MRGVPRSTRYSLTAAPRAAHLVDQREQRRAERHEIAQRVAAQQRDRYLEERFGRDIGVSDLAVRR